MGPRRKKWNFIVFFELASKFGLQCAGGSKILLAAGKGLEAFFNVYAVHKADHVMEIMETLRIGNVHIDDMKKVT